MKASVKHIALFLLLLPMLTGGCVTKALWNNGRLEAWKEPASNLNLRLFDDRSQTNLLVVYDEYSERSDARHTRAYWLNESQALLEQGRAPRFTKLSAMSGLTAVPVFYEPISGGINLPQTLCAVVATNQQMFTLYLAHQVVASHDLPVYNDGKGQVEKIVLTPLSVAADCTIVGTVFGYIYLQSNPSSFPGPIHF